MILMMTEQGEKEESRCGENDDSRGGGETEESRGGETDESRGGVNKENVQQKEDKRVNEEGLSSGRMVEDNKSR